METFCGFGGFLASALFGVLTFASGFITADIPNDTMVQPILNAGVAGAAFVAMWWLHRDALSRFEAKFQEMAKQSSEERVQRDVWFRDELRAQRVEMTTMMSRESDGWRQVIRELTLGVSALREAIEDKSN